MADVSGRRFVVTGAASGIGHAVAETTRWPPGPRSTPWTATLPTAAVARHIEVDLANPRSIDAAVEQLDGTFDGLMNVAGIPGTAPADLVLAVNSLAVRHLSEAFVRTTRSPAARWSSSPPSPASAGRRGWRPSGSCLATNTFEEGAAWFKEQSAAGQRLQLLQGGGDRVRDVDGSGGRRRRAFGSTQCCPGRWRRRSWSTSKPPWARTPSTALKHCLGRHATPDDIAGAVAVSGLRRGPVGQRPGAGRRRRRHRRGGHRRHPGTGDPLGEA